MALTDREIRLIEAIQDGLPLVPEPYAELGKLAGLSETAVIETLSDMQESGVIKRLGIVVRHRELGYMANGMVVWDVPDDIVQEVGHCFGTYDFVTLCYRRPRRLPDWPYNLFCMIHGKDRETVLRQADELAEVCGVEGVQRDVLFSVRRFKQRGAIYRKNGHNKNGRKEHVA